MTKRIMARLMLSAVLALLIGVSQAKAAPLYKESPACLAWKNIKIWASAFAHTDIQIPSGGQALDEYVTTRIRQTSLPKGYTATQLKSDLKAAGYEIKVYGRIETWGKVRGWQQSFALKAIKSKFPLLSTIIIFLFITPVGCPHLL